MAFEIKKNWHWILLILIILGVGTWLFYQLTVTKHLSLVWPNGKEVLRAGQTYQIKWKARKIGKIGLLLIEDKEPIESEWIVKDYPASKGGYRWEIFIWQKPSANYKIAILEYPWEEGKAIDYSDDRFTILGPTFASCDQLSIENEWPYLPSDFPNLKKVFVTTKKYSGNLGGLAGADEICQKEAEELGLEGNWKALLGDEMTSAVERLNLEGVFVEAEGTGTLPQKFIPSYFWQSFQSFINLLQVSKKEKEKLVSSVSLLKNYFQEFLKEWNKKQEKRSCHRLLGKNFEEFYQKLPQSLVMAEKSLGKNFSQKLKEVWIGRIFKESKKDCISIYFPYGSYESTLSYSFTTTCQNWTTEKEKIETKSQKDLEALPVCYTSGGQRIKAQGLGGLSIREIKKGDEDYFVPNTGSPCSALQRLICVQQ